MKKRPTSVSVISWLLIIVGFISLIAFTYMAVILKANANKPFIMVNFNLIQNRPILVWAVIAGYLGTIIVVTSGIAMLKRKNWGRFLYVISSGVALIIEMVVSFWEAILSPSTIIFVLFTIILFGSEANDYFTENNETINTEKI